MCHSVWIGLCLAGLFVGKEGPMIHSGAIVGAGLPQVQTLLITTSDQYYPLISMYWCFYVHYLYIYQISKNTAVKISIWGETWLLVFNCLAASRWRCCVNKVKGSGGKNAKHSWTLKCAECTCDAHFKLTKSSVHLKCVLVASLDCWWIVTVLHTHCCDVTFKWALGRMRALNWEPALVYVLGILMVY